MMGFGMKTVSRAPRVGRKLTYIPIIHTQQDMGNLGEAVKKAYLNKVGRVGWKRKQDVVNKFWEMVSLVVSRLHVEGSTTRVYQDGLAVTSDGSEIEVVKKLADSGSLNHRLLLELIRRGAILMGTESIELLLEEYEITRKILESPQSLNKSSEKQIRESQDDVLKRRDRFIANRINETLGEGELGIVFLGMLHNLGPWLSKDIQVDYPIRL